MTLTRSLAGLLALLHGINALAMIFAGHAWYESAPGVPSTGPYNPHFVVDIGLAFLVAAIGFGLWAWRAAIGAGVVWMAAAWPALHAVFHLIHWTHELPSGVALVTEAVGVVAVAALGLIVAWRAGRRLS